MGEANYFLISFFEHRDAIEVELESRQVRENRVRKPYGCNSVDLKTVYHC
jgi:hypothetical protein